MIEAIAPYSIFILAGVCLIVVCWLLMSGGYEQDDQS